jgi:acyl transferase domain-containing protein
VTALPIAVLGWLVGTLVSVLYVLPSDQAPVREAPEWAHTVEAGNAPDDRVDPDYQRRTQRACMRWYQRQRR